MATGHVFIATSLDGYIARPDNGLDWLRDEDGGDEDAGFAAFMDSVDGLVMGRGTYQTVLGFGGDWPYAKPVVVMSGSLGDDDLPEDLRGRVRVSRRDPAGVMADLASEGWSRAYVDGGALITSFLRARLIADMVITVAPVLIGSGKRLFGSLDGDIRLERVDTRTVGPGFVQTHYRVT